MSSPRCSISMEDLPEDIMFDILSRLPVKTIIISKCVCKKWRNLVLDSRFVHLQLPRSPDCVLIYQLKYLDSCMPPGTLKMLEIENELNHNHLLRKPFMSLDIAHLFPQSIVSTVGSVNGLICLWELGEEGDNTCICNPVTKEYMILPKQQFEVNNYWDLQCGFGVSASGEYKVVRFWRRDPFKIEVFTLGTNEWRILGQIPHGPENHHDGLFYNNNLHWIVASPPQLFSFSLDDENFQLFPLPHSLPGNVHHIILGVLNGCLCLFSWHKELEIKEPIIPPLHPEWYPESLIDGLKGRSIIFFNDTAGEDKPNQLFVYSLETNTIEGTTIFDNLFRVKNYRPSFLTLQNFHPARVHLI